MNTETTLESPSLEEIQSTLDWASEKQVAQIHALLHGLADPDDLPVVQDLVKACWHPPAQIDRLLCALDHVAQTHGVEALRLASGRVVAEYLNTGDSYTGTVIYDRFGDTPWQVTSVADFLDVLEARGVVVC